jgi:hypothetical protein
LKARSFLKDESGDILRHVVTIAVVFIINILVRFSIIQEAEDLAADAALQYYTGSNDEAKARELVGEKMKLMNFSDEEIRDSAVEFLPAGNVTKTVARVTVVRYARTLVSRHISWLNRLEKVTKTKEASIGGK